MKKKSIVGRLVNGEIVDEQRRDCILCDTIFALFPNVKEMDREFYEITISNRKTKGARRFYFKTVSEFNDILDWGRTESEAKVGRQRLYDKFENLVYSTFGAKQKQQDSITPRWISFELVK